MEDLNHIRFIYLMDFINLLENEKRVNFQNLLTFLGAFSEKYDKENAALPYHINLIDELHADENTYSRIFAKLLGYKANDKHLFLEKFLKELCGFNLTIKEPLVKKVDSCGRIDIPIFDKDYVVIIENKVTDKARDQNNSNYGQLAGYIETIKSNYNRKSGEIFVVYTPKYTREPSDNCWTYDGKSSYKEDFKDRFRSLSYRDNIYPWIKNELSAIIDEKEKYLHSAIEQYIDHLEGMFSLRTINNKMNMELQKFIKEQFGLPDNNPEEANRILSEKETELNNAINQIQQLKEIYQKQIVVNHFTKWKDFLKTDYPKMKIVGDNFKIDNSYINVGVEFYIDKLPLFALIECDDYNRFEDRTYIGIRKPFESKEKSVMCTLDEILNKNDLLEPDEEWYGWKMHFIEDVYAKLKKLINDIINQ